MVTLAALGVRASLVCRLRAAGFSERAAAAKAELFGRVARVLADGGVKGTGEVEALFVPGRIEVLGKHTDYAGGRTVVTTTEEGFCVVASGRDDQVLRITAAATGEHHEFCVTGDIEASVGHWTNYPMTVARRLVRNFGELRGADVAFISDLPAAAGMSSSSALIVAFALVLLRVNRLPGTALYQSNIGDTESLAEYLGTVENGQTFRTLGGDAGVGTFGGSEDHTAILCSRPGQLSQYSYGPVRLERRLALPSDHVFALAGSGVIAEKTGAVGPLYNRASLLARAAVGVWNEATGRGDAHLAAALASGPGALAQLRGVLRTAAWQDFSGEQLSRRFEHFYAESEEIVPAAGDALSRANMEEFGRQVDRSQELADTLLRNQVEETVFLARAARQLHAVAASAFGGGFGGGVWALVRAQEASAFLDAWAQEYHRVYADRAEQSHFFTSEPSPAAFALD